MPYLLLFLFIRVLNKSNAVKCFIYPKIQRKMYFFKCLFITVFKSRKVSNSNFYCNFQKNCSGPLQQNKKWGIIPARWDTAKDSKSISSFRATAQKQNSFKAIKLKNSGHPDLTLSDIQTILSVPSHQTRNGNEDRDERIKLPSI